MKLLSRDQSKGQLWTPRWWAILPIGLALRIASVAGAILPLPVASAVAES